MVTHGTGGDPAAGTAQGPNIPRGNESADRHQALPFQALPPAPYPDRTLTPMPSALSPETQEEASLAPLGKVGFTNDVSQ